MLGNLVPWKKKNESLTDWKSTDHPLVRLRQEFDELWNRFWDDWRTGTLSPREGTPFFGSRMELEDQEKAYVLRAELPGFEPKDFDVKISGNVLTLKAEHREEGKKGNGSYHRFGSFFESITLPQGVLADKIEARYHSGIIELHLPKSPDCQSKKIEVKAV